MAYSGKQFILINWLFIKFSVPFNDFVFIKNNEESLFPFPKYGPNFDIKKNLIFLSVSNDG